MLRLNWCQVQIAPRCRLSFQVEGRARIIPAQIAASHAALRSDCTSEQDAEYSLLSFLATHPNRAYSREVLLHRVWGFEYCGGTRTVDVHIRRIRSKVGPLIAAHITTVRGVGYLFKE